jgi:tetraacyldisaccharide 4'-kinase
MTATAARPIRAAAQHPILSLVLRPVAWAYGGVIAARNAWYDNPARCQRAGVPVISVGNITAGGTGKTPLVIELVHGCGRWGGSRRL